MPATARLEFRVQPEQKRRLERAAELTNEPLSEFVRGAAEGRAEQVLQEFDARILVPATFFDDMLAALEEPARPNEPLRRAFVHARDLVDRE